MVRSVLIADDEEHIRHLLRLYFQKEGYTVLEAITGEQAVQLFYKKNPDLVILDIMMPEINGWEVLKLIRKKNRTPIIMLTAKDTEVDKILGLEMGADDYVTKPFSPRELISRAKAVLRRSSVEVSKQEIPASTQENTRESDWTSDIINYPGLSINRSSREITVNSNVLNVPPKEFDLLWVLAKNPNKVFTREYLLETIWGYSYFGAVRTVDVHVRRLRKKIEKEPEQPRYLKTVWGVGYKFDSNPEST